MSIFRSIVELAFKSASIDANVSSGAFSLRLSLDEWANDQDVLSSFAGIETRSNPPSDFRTAILGGTRLPSSFLPSDVSRHAIYEDDRYLTVWLPFPDGVLYVWDFENCAGVMWCTTETMPSWLLSRPILPLLHAYASQTEWCPVHASAVGRNGEFLLMIGPGGAGKSTAALSCVAAGWQYAGDDFVLINPTQRLVKPLYASGRLRVGGPERLAASLSRFIFAESNEGDESRLEMRFSTGDRQIPIEGGTIARVLIPRRRGDPAFQIERARPADAFACMIPFTRVYTPGRAEQLTKKILSAAGMVPAYFVETGRDAMAIPAGLQTILDGAP
ncbi:hypothetical protein [Bradyrhizobium prioriisuperbiae]|uniref:hypothetical protein n=1 Tax=Bradyrhizobium prioriisuperbiae TaxID=2854389 RepID=UPI0028EE065C|nr:hypothetical protein [Bradyrhizobium prioritasuperba]